MNEAESAREKLDRICEALPGYAVPLGDPIWSLIDGVYADIDRLEKKAYLTIRVPGFLRRRVAA